MVFRCLGRPVDCCAKKKKKNELLCPFERVSWMFGWEEKRRCAPAICNSLSSGDSRDGEEQYVHRRGLDFGSDPRN